MDAKYLHKAERILKAMENSPITVDWPEIDRPDLKMVIAKELKKMEKEGNNEEP